MGEASPRRSISHDLDARKGFLFAEDLMKDLLPGVGEGRLAEAVVVAIGEDNDEIVLGGEGAVGGGEGLAQGEVGVAEVEVRGVG